MSDTEIIGAPQANVWLQEDDGLSRWRPEFDVISVRSARQQVVIRAASNGNEVVLVIGSPEAMHVGRRLIEIASGIRTEAAE
jgi:hypothetical protein